MTRKKCITFDKEAQDNLPEHIKLKMKADRDKAIADIDIKNAVGSILKFRRRHFSTEKKDILFTSTYWGANIDNFQFTSPADVNSAPYFIDDRFSGFLDENKLEIYENDTVYIHKNPNHGKFIVKYGIYKRKSFANGDLQRTHLGFYLWKDSYKDERGIYHSAVFLSLAELFEPIKNNFESTKSITVINPDCDNESYCSDQSCLRGFNCNRDLR